MENEMESAIPSEETLPNESEILEVEQTEAEPSAGESNTPDDERPKPKGVQKRIDELTANWRNEQRRAEQAFALLEQITQQQGQPVEQYQAPYQPAYDGYEQSYMPQFPQEYAQPQVNPEQIVSMVEQQLKSKFEAEQFGQAVEQFKSKITDPDARAFVESEYSPITREMADVMMQADNGAQIATYFARNQSDAARIAQLPPHLQAFEIAKVSTQLQNVKRPTSAPNPATTLSGQSKPEIDPDKMSPDQWLAWRQQQLKA